MNKLLLALGLLLLVSACSHTPTVEENKRLYKVGNPYNVGGRVYHPREDPYYDEVGEASWYGPGFGGNKTADGEDFDKYDMTAAHRTLPMPSIVRVTNLENGRSANLRVNDRGPFARSRIIDVSKKAAEVLGFYNKGKARVRVQFLPEETAALFGGKLPESTLASAYDPKKKVRQYRAATVSTPAPVQAPERQIEHETAEAQEISAPVQRPQYPTSHVMHASQYAVQVGVFRKKENAQRVVKDVSRFGVAKMEEIHQEGERFFCVRVSSFSDEGEAGRALNLIQNSGYNDAQLLSY